MAGRTIEDTEEIYTSRVFKFIVGQQETEFFVHEKLVAPCSAAIKTMFESGMRESQEGVVIFRDLDASVFASFLDFATFRDYKFLMKQEPTNHQPEVDDDHRSPEKRCDSLRDHLLQYQKCPELVRKTPYLRYMYLFVKNGGTGGLYGPPSGCNASNPNPPFDVSLDLAMLNREFAEVSQHHVKLYIFADQWDVPELKQLCLHRLHRCVAWARLSDSGYNLLFDMIDLAYSNTMPGDGLRKLFTQMCVADISMVRSMPGFPRLAHRMPDIAVDILPEEPKYWHERAEALEDVKRKFQQPSVDNEELANTLNQ